MLIKFQPLTTGLGVLAHLRIDGRDQYVCALYDERATDLTSEDFVQPEAYVEFRDFFKTEHGDAPLVKRYQRDPDIVTLDESEEDSLFIMDAFSAKTRGLVCLQTASRASFANILDSLGLTKEQLVHLSELNALISSPPTTTKVKKLVPFHTLVDNLAIGQVFFNTMTPELKANRDKAKRILTDDRLAIIKAGKVSLGTYHSTGIADHAGLFENIDTDRITLPYPETVFHLSSGTLDDEQVFILARQDPTDTNTVRLRFFATNSNLKNNQIAFMNNDVVVKRSNGELKLELHDFLTNNTVTKLTDESTRNSYLRSCFMALRFLNNLNRPNARLEIIEPQTKRLKFKKGVSDYFGYSVLHAPETTLEYYARYGDTNSTKAEGAGYEVSLHRRRGHRGLRKTREGWKRVHISATWVGSSQVGVKSLLLDGSKPQRS